MFWRFPDGTHFSYRGRVYKKDSFCSGTYLSKLHGVTIEYFCPLRRFTFINPEKGFPGTVIDAEQMAVILIDDPLEHDVARRDYLDVLLARAQAQEALREYGATPYVPDPLLVEPRDTWPSLLLAITRSAFALPRQAVLYGYVATVARWRKERGCFLTRWALARWDFWNQPARNLDGHIPWNPHQPK